MRKIKIRGRALKTKEWVYGYYWTNENGNHFIRRTMDLNGCFIVEDIEVNPETIGQYTGLKDKNNVEIYEGDILRNYSNEIEDWTVFYEDGKFIGTFDNVCEDLYELKDLEVIGNIHDNPELKESN